MSAGAEPVDAGAGPVDASAGPRAEPWRLGIDYGPATSHAPGVGRYARELVRALVRLERIPELLLLELARGPRILGDRALGLAAARGSLAVMGAPVPRRLIDLLGRAGLGADRLLGGVDLFHDVRPQPLPVSRARRTWAISELPPEGSPALAATAAAARGMDALLTFSRHGAGEIVRRLDVPAERVHVTPVGAEHFRRALAERTGDGEPRPPAEPPYVLALGAALPHRRPFALIAALERLWAGGLRVGLVLAGRAGPGAEQLRAALRSSALGRGARWIEEPAEDGLPELLARASVLCHLSGAELTPVTPLEALALGVPVVASRLPAFAEPLGGVAELIESGGPGDPGDGELAVPLAAALERALASRSDPAAIRRRQEQAAPYTWGACAATTLAVWRGLVEAGEAGGRAVVPGR